ncbi:hypothetical protein AVEN_192207-1 [Araneus ventricosus]|uniref:Uncharacterized protein n=1 Tax=Araneus ventricosus TaxID=182803 RepID=A0A4Y2US67_ARAVE|nr:hypothetical protein AVEN_192207-1 [Araneus ventricosus]
MQPLIGDASKPKLQLNLKLAEKDMLKLTSLGPKPSKSKDSRRSNSLHRGPSRNAQLRTHEHNLPVPQIKELCCITPFSWKIHQLFPQRENQIREALRCTK